MELLNKYAPDAYDAVRMVQRELRPKPHANVFSTAFRLLGLDEPLGMVEGPARAVGPIARVGREAAERIAGATRALDDLNRAPSVQWGMEPEWVSERRGFPASGAPGSVERRSSEGADEVFAFDRDGNLVGVLSQAREGAGKGAVKITVRDDARRQGWGTRLLDEARRAGLDVEGSIGANRFTPEGRALFRSWLQRGQ